MRLYLFCYIFTLQFGRDAYKYLIPLCILQDRIEIPFYHILQSAIKRKKYTYFLKFTTNYFSLDKHSLIRRIDSRMLSSLVA